MKVKTEVCSFFSGLGILDLGFEDTGFNISFVNEYNKTFLEAYKYTRGDFLPKYGYSNLSVEEYLNDDVWNRTFKKKFDADFVGFIGGPPCPDFSTAGRNKGVEGKNGILTDVYVNLIIKRKPDFFVLENVKGLYQTSKHKVFYEEIKKRLDENGYQLFNSIENALEYGVPQYRDRLFLIGFNKDIFKDFHEFSIGRHKVFDLKEIKLLNWPTKENFIEKSFIKKPINIIEELTVEYWFEKNDVKHHRNQSDVFKVKNLQKYLTIKEGDVSRKSFKRLHRWRYAPTSAYGNNEVHLHPYELRRISVAEALSIQSLPKEFHLPNNIPISLKFKMIGNGVPYLLGKGIAQDIFDYLNVCYQAKRKAA